MRKCIFFVFLSMLCSLSIAYGAEKIASKALINEVPMYGEIERTPDEKKIDENFIQNSIKQFGSREAAIQNKLALAWNYCNAKNDLKAAMKQFNQVWLLDPKDAEAFYGFGFLATKKGDSDNAIIYYQKAIDLDPSHAMAMCNLASEYKNKGSKILYENKKAKEGWDYLGKALKLYEKASKSAKLDKDFGYIYYQWAVALEIANNYIEAWEKIKLSRKYGAHFIEPQFIKKLSKSMLEPINDIRPASTESLGLEKRLFLTFEVDKKKAYINEEIAISIKLFVNHLNLTNIKLPTLLQNELSKPEFGEPNQSRKKIDGLTYYILEFKAKISGIKPGSYKLGPAKTDCYVLTGNLKQRHEAYSVELKSQDIDIVISPPPVE